MATTGPPGNASRIAAVILAGGRGERLGGADKARLELGGETLLNRVRRTLEGCTPVLVAVGQRAPSTPEDVSDLPAPHAGPLAGLAAAVAALTSEPADMLLSVAVDTPFFPPDFLARAEAMRAPTVIAAYRGQLYPTNALWRFESIADLAEACLAGTAPRSLKRLAESLGAVALDYADLAAEDPFFNINTPTDLAAARSRLSG